VSLLLLLLLLLVHFHLNLSSVVRGTRDQITV
jgi:hypothetical protein